MIKTFLTDASLILICPQKRDSVCISIVGTGASPIGANVRKWVRTNGGRETVGVEPCADPGLWATRVGTRLDPYDCPPCDLLESMGPALSLRMKMALLKASWYKQMNGYMPRRRVGSSRT